MASKIAGLYDMEDTLGSGHFAVVKSARHVFTGLRVAVKVIDKTKLDDVSKTHLYQEVRCMKLVSHPCIIRLYEVIDTQTKLYLIEELGDGGDLYDFIMKHPNGVNEDLGRCIFRQTVSAIQYCHQLHVVHRDLKPENLVFCQTASNNVCIKLTDFGLSRTFMPGEMIESSCGSLEYSAPEILLGDFYDPPKVDVWSLGVILFMLICGHSPFVSGGASETLTHIMDGRYEIPAHVSESCRDLIRRMLVVDAIQRCSLNDVVTHPWLNEGSVVDPLTLPSINLPDIPSEEVHYILERMEAGGYGSTESILESVQDKPYGSVAATFYLLAEAERHRKLHVQSPQHVVAPCQISASVLGGAGGGETANTSRKISVPTQPPLNNILKLNPAGGSYKSHGHAETGVLLPRRRTTPEEPVTSKARSSSSPTHLTKSPYQNPNYTSPRLGVGGEQVSNTNTRKPLFPIQSVAEDSTGLSETDSQSTLDLPPPPPRMRHLSACEEEGESDEVIVDGMRSQSPLPSPRSRRLLSARSSPNLAKSVSRSDFSDEEDDDDIMDLSTVPRSHPTHPSPLASPHLSYSRLSPTHSQGYSSDEESLSHTLLYDGRRKRSSKRIRYNKALHPLVRVDSASSDDGSFNDKHLRHSLPKFGKDKLRKMLPYRSTPSTPAEGSGSESFTDMLAVRMRSSSGGGRPRCNSARTDSSLSDTNELSFQIHERLELSDGEELDKPDEP
uniref:SNF-related serine/threonine-protein kinase n=1 Tax=Amphimedon queenslandica TaxID=400682 RepID=A0A1X7ULS3_AMPQE